MNIKYYESQYDNKRFRIEGPYEDIGAYLFIFENDDVVNKYDYLQDTIQICMEFAFEDFNVPLDSWVELPEGTKSCYFDE